ncbi:hypothetical protein Agabi119p4_8617 [Agaricus bisporus var. burnettii]|uniref:Uncharacterized protein n=1 Tax=Agaricus bisporus var. burnettii TaxID=192524 RepID=A0A8H7C7F1_AGABI|nr:hypothetical protein Agabi119p4_8617 [Agaricus bisporus var. burnettii]
MWILLGTGLILVTTRRSSNFGQSISVDVKSQTAPIIWLWLNNPGSYFTTVPCCHIVYCLQPRQVELHPKSVNRSSLGIQKLCLMYQSALSRSHARLPSSSSSQPFRLRQPLKAPAAAIEFGDQGIWWPMATL